MNQSTKDMIVEISHDLDNAEFARQVAIQASGRLSVVPARMAFRKYEFIERVAVPMKNQAGNMRGMVICKRAKVAYNFIINSRSALMAPERAFFVAGLAVNVLDQYDDMESIVNSNESLSVKAGKLIAHADSILMRTSLGILKPASGVLAWALAKDCDWAASRGLLNNSCSSTVHRYQKQFETNFDQVTDAKHVYSVVSMTLNRIEDNIVDSLSKLY